MQERFVYPMAYVGLAQVGIEKLLQQCGLQIFKIDGGGRGNVVVSAATQMKRVRCVRSVEHDTQALL